MNGISQHIWQPRSGQREVMSYKMMSFVLLSRLEYVVSQIKREKS